MGAKKVAVFRVDANEKIGSGHVLRCITLAEKLKDLNFEIYFACINLQAMLKEQINQRGYELLEVPPRVYEIEFFNMRISSLGADAPKILIIDSDKEELYASTLQERVREHCWKLMYFTFYDKFDFKADIVLNQNIRAAVLNYKKEPYTQMLLGTDYLILKDKYRSLKAAINPLYSKKKNICLLFFGGADLKNNTLRILTSLYHKPKLFDQVVVVLGTLNRNIDRLKIVSQKAPMQVDVHINTPLMPEIMAEAKFAITSGGLTIWELAALQTLQLILPSSDRELTTARYCEEKGWVHFLNIADSTSSLELADLIETAIIDSANEQRVKSFERQIPLDGADKVAAKIEQTVNT